MRKHRTLTDLNEMPGWEKVDNDTSRHDATSVVVTRVGQTPRPWRVFRLGRFLGGSYRHVSSAIDRALTEVFELTYNTGIPKTHPVTGGVSLEPAFDVPEVEAVLVPHTTAGRPYRTCPDGSVVIDTEDVTDIVLEREDLLAMLDVDLAKAWREGLLLGFGQGQADACDVQYDEVPNPYRKTAQ